MINSVNPSTGELLSEVAPETTEAEVVALTRAADSATSELAQLGRVGRAALLRRLAKALDENRTELVSLADAETGLGTTRLSGEFTRTCYQLDLFADVLDDGGYLEATIDHAGDTPMGPRPDLRRLLLPLGPVAVFGASNFPFAFSVPGGDTASALAAGCPVIAKVHGAHPATSVLVHQVLSDAAVAYGVAGPIVSLVFGQRAGLQLVKDPYVRAVGFTGSLSVGRLLFDAASSRPSPVPFYGELGALNTFAVCRQAAADRGSDIGAGLAASVALSVGQFCTKPGLAFVPRTPGGDALVDALTQAMASTPAGVMLSERTSASYEHTSATLQSLPGVTVLARASDHSGPGWRGSPLVLEAQADALADELLDECFGPSVVVVRYDSDDELVGLLDRCTGALTATIHADEDDRDTAERVFNVVQQRVGRIVWNGYPTGVAVSWAMHHGGPYPATTNALHTSVGTSAIRRWLRPISLQNVPAYLLPEELREDSVELPRRIDGRMQCQT